MIPVAIQTYPLNGGAKRRQNKAKLPANQNEDQSEETKSVVQSPFPTLFWLTCPDISKAVANLERRGFVQIIEDELNENPELIFLSRGICRAAVEEPHGRRSQYINVFFQLVA
eukprot:CAMPEP_0116082216 /NCGR_PEP_ID=MMETSP0327-20121206/2614_1 /TAXON_ID=44447 /ORGANISM="Pseudo-nitzschia delicatissima, Strain B596" /LENGTH=112 /DNA_ID=CAMNT_0003573007 /DNA_START=334 /DNA_END=668 /DNA_ORIENTATION=+